MPVSLGNFIRVVALTLQIFIGEYLLLRTRKKPITNRKRTLQYAGVATIVSGLVMIPDVIFMPLEHFFIPDTAFQLFLISMFVLRAFKKDLGNLKTNYFIIINTSWFFAIIGLRLIGNSSWEIVWLVGTFAISLYCVSLILWSFYHLKENFSENNGDFFFQSSTAFFFTGIGVIIAFIVPLTAFLLSDILLEGRLLIQDLGILVGALIAGMALYEEMNYSDKKDEEIKNYLIKELKRANQDLESFAYVVSHDLKAPLRSIISLVEWLSKEYKEKLDDTGNEYLSLIISNTERMEYLINDILEYSRIESTDAPLTEVNLNTVVNEVITLIKPPENIHINVENSLPSVYCVKTQIRQIYLNLISNAVKYMDKPEGHIILGYTEDDHFWTLYVSDNGPGIDEKYFKTLFLPFNLIKPNKSGENSGLGLAIVKKIIEKYNGKIWVESKIKEGSTFFFTFPKYI